MKMNRLKLSAIILAVGLIAAVLILLCAAMVWGIFGRLNTTLNFYVRSDIQQMKAATDKFANAFGL